MALSYKLGQIKTFQKTPALLQHPARHTPPSYEGGFQDSGKMEEQKTRRTGREKAVGVEL